MVHIIEFTATYQATVDRRPPPSGRVMRIIPAFAVISKTDVQHRDSAQKKPSCPHGLAVRMVYF
jgi:hypothetical protein